MEARENAGIPYKPFPTELQSVEREKSRLILEAQMLKAQQLFTKSAQCFAQAARHEQSLANWAKNQGLNDLSYLHSFSSLSCWSQAGDPHRALEMSRDLLLSKNLSVPQRKQLQHYHDILEQRWVSWMQQWSPPVFTPA